MPPLNSAGAFFLVNKITEILQFISNQQYTLAENKLRAFKEKFHTNQKN